MVQEVKPVEVNILIKEKAVFIKTTDFVKKLARLLRGIGLALRVSRLLWSIKWDPTKSYTI